MILFSYDLVGTGWAECTLEVKNKKVKITASYLSDALGDLSMAIYKALCGEKDSRAIFTDEPGEYRWIFKKANEKITELKIIKYIDYDLNLPDEDGVVIFEENIDLLEFSNAFVEEVSKLIERYGLDGYRETWHLYDYPQKTIDKIRVKLLESV